MTRRFVLAVPLAATALARLRGEDPGLERILRIEDLERRSREALGFAFDQLEVAARAYGEPDLQRGRAALDAVGRAAEAAVQALEATGKHPRRHPRHFKHAEIRTRKLLQQLKQARRKVPLQDEADFDAAIKRVEKVNAALLLGIMSPRN